MRNIWKDLALLCAGALISVVGAIVLQPRVYSLPFWILIFILIGLFLYGSGAITKALASLRLWRRKGFWFLVPKIGILNDMRWDAANNETHSWTEVSPGEWKALLESKLETCLKAKVRLIDAEKDFDSYIAVLNPYGGVYPENDLKTSRTLSKIFDYVNKGGIFVNVADIPGYWAYNKILKRRLDATPVIYGIDRTKEGSIEIIPVRPFMLTPFMEKLGLQVYNTDIGDLHLWKVEFEDKFDDSGTIGEITVHRVAAVEKNLIPVIKHRKLMPNVNATPLFLVNYGEGSFIISLVFESSDNNKKIEDPIANVLTRLVRRKARNGKAGV